VKTDRIKAHMEVIDADGFHVGTIDRVERHRIRLKKPGSDAHREEHHRYIELTLVAGVEGDKVQLSAAADDNRVFEEDKSGRPVRR